MRILFLAPSAEPESSSGAYVVAMAEEMARLGVEARAAGFGEDRAAETRRKRIAAAVREFRPDWISLQFVAYAFDRRGIAWGVGRELRALAPGAAWHVMCHELWIGAWEGAPLRHRLLGRLQRLSLVRNLRALRPRAVHTSNPTYRELLAGAGIGAGLLPLIGNIPVAPPSADGDRALRALFAARGVDLERPEWFLAGLFGSLVANWPPEPLLSLLARFQERSGRRVALVAAGRLGPGRELWARLERDYGGRFLFVMLGEQPSEVLSRLFRRLDCGLAATPWQVIGKSGAVAAMLEHGLPVVVNRTERYGLPSDDAPASDPLLLRLGDDLPERLAALPPRRPPAPRLPGTARRLLSDLTDPTEAGP